MQIMAMFSRQTQDMDCVFESRLNTGNLAAKYPGYIKEKIVNTVEIAVEIDLPLVVDKNVLSSM